MELEIRLTWIIAIYETIVTSNDS